jgi:hypothetical protein
MVNDVLFQLDFELVALGWRVWVSLIMKGVLLNLGLNVGVVG